jgi:hypothetical protein
MASLYKRANMRQERILRVVAGAVKNALDAHPKAKIDRKFARSVAKRAAGTLTAQWPEVLALPRAASVCALSKIQEGGAATMSRIQRGGATGSSEHPRGAGYARASRGWGGSDVIEARPSFKRLHKELSKIAGEYRRAGEIEPYNAIVRVLRLVSKMRGQVVI